MKKRGALKDVQENKPAEAIEDAWQDKHCVRMKINRLKLEVVVHPETKRTTTSDLVLLDKLSFASLIKCVWDKTLPSHCPRVLAVFSTCALI